MGFTAEQLRANRARKNYGSNIAGELVRKKTFRDFDYTQEGHLVQFDDEPGFIAFEEERYRNGQHQAHYSTKVRDTVPREQLALEYIAAADAMNNDVAKQEGHETRAHMEQTVEGLHERHDKQEDDLREIRAHQKQENEDQKAILEKKARLADKQKARNEAFANRVEAGAGTPLEEKELQLKILTEDIRKTKAEEKLKKQREKARKQSEKAAANPRGAAAKRQTQKITDDQSKKRPREDNEEHGDLKKKKVAELRKICKDKGLDHKGKKAQLVQRISAQGAEQVAPGPASGSEAPSGQNGEQAAQGVASSGSGGEVPADHNGGQAAQGIASSGSGGEVPPGQNGDQASDDDNHRRAHRAARTWKNEWRNAYEAAAAAHL